MKSTADVRPTANPIDAELAHQVKHFLNKSRGGCQRVEVQVDSGAVRLTGSVGSFFLRQAAIALAKQVSGDRHVLDELRVDSAEAVIGKR
jgi:osmotically-inducible protein OsmY